MSFPLRPIRTWPSRGTLPPQLAFLVAEYPRLYLSKQPAPPQWCALDGRPFATFDQFVAATTMTATDASVLTTMFATLLRFGNSLVAWRLVLQRRTDGYVDKLLRYALRELLGDPDKLWLNASSRYQLRGAEMIRLSLAGSEHMHYELPHVLSDEHGIVVAMDTPYGTPGDIPIHIAITRDGDHRFRAAFPENAFMSEEHRMVSAESAWFDARDSDVVSPVMFAVMLSIIVRDPRITVAMPLHFRDTWIDYVLQRHASYKHATRLLIPAFDAETLDPFVVARDDANLLTVDVLFVLGHAPSDTTMIALKRVFFGATVQMQEVPASSDPPARILLRYIDRHATPPQLRERNWLAEFDNAVRSSGLPVAPTAQNKRTSDKPPNAATPTKRRRNQ